MLTFVSLRLQALAQHGNPHLAYFQKDIYKRSDIYDETFVSQYETHTLSSSTKF